MHVDYKVLDSGCCGLAGAFGYESDKYSVSVAVAEHGIVPKLREASPDTLVIADGFSCRSQIEQMTDRTPVHLAEAIASALSGKEALKHATEVRQQARKQERSSRVVAGLVLGGLILAGFVHLWRARLPVVP